MRAALALLLLIASCGGRIETVTETEPQACAACSLCLIREQVGMCAKDGTRCEMPYAPGCFEAPR